MKTKILSFLILDLFVLTLAVLTYRPSTSGNDGMVFAEADGLEVNYPYTKTFIISAYYSPLPCQNRYATGTYEADIRLNGRGVRGADGTGVYPGMIAAPKAYSFGTKMDIPGIGIVAVHDRGGAIVTANGINAYDRLDVWMGYGDKGLTRALNWGKRTFDVVVYGVNDGVAEQIALSDYDASEAFPTQCGVAPEEPAVVEAVAENVIPDVTPVEVVETVVPEQVVVPTEVVEPVAVNIDLLAADFKLGDSGEGVRKLQVELSRLNFFKADVSGYYGDVTEHAVFKFQQSQGLVADKGSQFAGIFGPKTRDRLNEIVATASYNEVRIAQATDSYNKIHLATNIAADKPKKRILTAKLGFGMTGGEVISLQNFLKEKGYFDGAFITDYFGPVTKEALLQFQKDHNLINSGTVDQETLEVINTLS
ncbi:MAG: peptidoglycan-binding protein [Patescibacteria group bacterium]